LIPDGGDTDSFRSQGPKSAGFFSKLLSPFAGDVVDVTSAGISVGSTPQGGFLTLGYSRQVTAALRNNVLVLGDPLALPGSSVP
jgi:hypothetical protein